MPNDVMPRLRGAAHEALPPPMLRMLLARGVRMPSRIQWRCVKGWRMPPQYEYVGRGSRWGNPFRVGDVCGYCGHTAETVEEVVAWYARWVEAGHGRYTVVQYLRGKT